MPLAILKRPLKSMRNLDEFFVITCRQLQFTQIICEKTGKSSLTKKLSITNPAQISLLTPVEEKLNFIHFQLNKRLSF